MFRRSLLAALLLIGCNSRTLPLGNGDGGSFEDGTGVPPSVCTQGWQFDSAPRGSTSNYVAQLGGDGTWHVFYQPEVDRNYVRYLRSDQLDNADTVASHPLGQETNQLTSVSGLPEVLFAADGTVSGLADDDVAGQLVQLVRTSEGWMELPLIGTNGIPGGSQSLDGAIDGNGVIHAEVGSATLLSDWQLGSGGVPAGTQIATAQSPAVERVFRAPDGRIHVFFNDMVVGDMHATTDANGNWIVDSLGTSPFSGRLRPIGVDAQGTAHALYGADWASGVYPPLQHLSLPAGATAWVSESTGISDDSIFTGALAPDGSPHIVTFTLTPTGAVEDAATLTWWTPSHGSWQPTNLPGANPAIDGVQLAFDAAGHPHFLLATRNYDVEYFTFVTPC